MKVFTPIVKFLQAIVEVEEHRQENLKTFSSPFKEIDIELWDMMDLVATAHQLYLNSLKDLLELLERK